MKKMHRSLYRELLIKMTIFLILPFLIMSIFLYSQSLQDWKKSYQTTQELIISQAQHNWETHIENIYQIANRISSNPQLTGFFLTHYTNKMWGYYANDIMQIASNGFIYDNSYTLRIYFENTTIPQGFNTFYHISNLLDVEKISNFISSESNELWLTPTETENFPQNLYTPFQGNYTYLRKVSVDKHFLYLITLSIKKDEFNSFLTVGEIDTVAPYKKEETSKHLLLNFCSDSMTGEQIADHAHKLTIKQVSFLGFPQEIVFVWEKNPQRKYWWLSFLFFLAFAGIAIGTVILFVRKLFHQIFSCIHSFNDSARNGFRTKLILTGDNEITHIKRCFNTLIDRVQNLMHITAEQSVRVQESRLKALQHQINPHFLYNTLTLFSYRMELYQHYDEADAMTAFSDMLRYSISNEKYATLDEEIFQVENYIQIQKLKYPNITFQIIAPPALRGFHMIRFILQPLIENSFLHGYCERPLHILLSCTELEHDILFEIYDNGKGIPDETLSSIKNLISDEREDTNENIGLKNIHLRLKLFYPGNSGLQIYSQPEKWTLITFHISK